MHVHICNLMLGELCNVPHNPGPKVNAKVQKTYFLVNASLLDVATWNFAGAYIT